MRVLYLDCFSGVAGDMLLGALLDCGVDPAAWKADLGMLPLDGYTLRVERARRGAIDCGRVVVEVDPAARPAHRRLGDVFDILRAGRLPEAALARAMAAFRRLAEAEARVHGAEPETVVFHEVGAIDAIVDIAGTALAVERLGVARVVCSPIRVGRTTVETAHGALPTPAPATAFLLEGVPVEWAEAAAELATPTGVALAVTLADGFGAPPSGRFAAVGYGAGGLELEGLPNAVRAIVIEAGPAGAAERIAVLEANIDDMSPEHVGAVVPRLLAAGALDAFTAPVTMKKGRPGLRLTVLAPTDRRQELAAAMMRETTTFGVRMHEVERTVLDREHVRVETPWGPARVKVGRLDGRVITAAPEHDDCARLAESAGVPIRDVYESARAAFRDSHSA